MHCCSLHSCEIPLCNGRAGSSNDPFPLAKDRHAGGIVH